jgi:hypothetical protein
LIGAHIIRVGQMRRAFSAKVAGAISAIAGLVLLGASHARATTYDVSITQGVDSISGTITTDGATGSLSVSDISGWNLSVNSGTGTVGLLGPGAGQNSNVTLDGAGLLTATNSQLSFLFDSDSTAGFFQISTVPNYIACPSCTFFDLGAYGGTAGPFADSGYITLYANSSYGAGSGGAAYTGSDLIGTAETAAPLPATVWLLLSGIIGLGFFVRRGKTSTSAATAAV